jgi:S-adenosylmethionine decarboxylase
MGQKSHRRYHLIIDAQNCLPEKLTDEKLLDAFIRQLAQKIEMKILAGPYIIKGEPYNPGITAFTIIDFSHISIHTFTKDNEFCLDIFSCKEFNHEMAVNFVKETFELKDEQMNVINV